MRLILCCLGSATLASLLTWGAVRSGEAPLASTGPQSAPARVAGGVPGRGIGAHGAASSGGSDARSGTQEKEKDALAALRGKDGLISPESMESALAAMLAENDPLAAMDKFTALLRELTPENAAAAWDAISSQAHGPEAMRYLPLLAHTWGTVDGAGSLAALKDGSDKDDIRARLSVMSGWAGKDPDGALAWIKAQEADKSSSPDDLRLLKSGLIRGVAAQNPDAAMGMLASMDEKERAPLMGIIAREQYRLGMDAAAAWAGNIADPAQRASAMASLLRQHAEEDPAKAAAWLSARPDLMGDGMAVGALARQWADQDPGAAIQWISSLPEGAARNEAWEDAMRSWSKDDPLASSTYLTQMPAGPSRDSAVSSLSRTIARKDPDAALQWAASIQDPAAREAAIVRSVQLWRSVDEAGAANWIQTSGMSAEAQQRMLEAIPGKEGRPQKNPDKARRKDKGK